jgi:flagellar hook-associated protein 2
MAMSLGGLASGMDTESIIQQLMAIERQPIYRYEQEKTELNTAKDAWRDVNSRISNLESKLSPLKLSATFNSNKASASDKDVATATASNDAAEGIYELTVKETARSHRLGSTQKVDQEALLTDELTNLTDVSGDVVFNQGQDNEAVISVTNDDTLSSLADKINEADAGVNASIVDGHLVLESTETGEENSINLTDNVNGLMTELGFSGDLNDENNTAVLQTANDAVIEINGITDITSSTNTFSDAVEGVSFSINQDAEVDSTSIITVEQDTGKAQKAVQAFVDQYNSTMNFIDSKTNYDAETETSGTLQGDSTLMRVQMRLRNLATDRIDTTGDYRSLSAVGVSVDRDGVMSLDGDKFTEALTEAPDEVMNLFKASSDEEGYDGVATKLDSYTDQLIQSNTGVIPRRLDYFDTQIESIDDDIVALEDSLERTRERYQSQFTAMETALAEMQQQSSWLSSQISSLGSSNLTSMM